MVKGSKRIIWTDESVAEFFNNGIKVELSDEVKSKLDTAIYKVGDYYIDHSMTCKKDTMSSRKVLVVCKKDGHRAYRAMSDILKSKYECFGCVTKNLENCLEKKNYILVDYQPLSEKSTIKCTVCDNQFEYLKSAILGKNNIDCETCRVRRIKESCAIKDYSYISHYRTNNAIVVKVRCNSCNNEYEKYSSELYKSRKKSCKGCYDMSLFTANAEGFSVKNIANEGITFECNTCGESYFKSRTAVVRGIKEIICKTCRLSLIKQILKEKCCTYLSDVKNIVTYQGTDGTIFTRTSGVIFSNKFPCNSNNRRNQRFFLYVVKLVVENDAFIKVGIAVNVERRLKDLKLNNYEILLSLPFENCSKAQLVEKNLHNKFREFSIAPDVAKSFCNRIIRNKHDGITEWFDNAVITAGLMEIANDLHGNA